MTGTHRPTLQPTSATHLPGAFLHAHPNLTVNRSFFAKTTPLLQFLTHLPLQGLTLPFSSHPGPKVEPGVPAEGPDRPSVGPAYRHVWARHGFPPALHGAATCAQLWAISVRRHGSNPCLGWRRLAADGKPGPYTFISYCQADEQVRGSTARRALRVHAALRKVM